MERTSGAEGVSACRFDSDDVGSEVSEELAGVDGSVVGEVDDTDVVEGAGWLIGHVGECSGGVLRGLNSLTPLTNPQSRP